MARSEGNKLLRGIWAIAVAGSLLIGTAAAQQADQPPSQEQQKNEIPDAPSATRPPQQFPNAGPASRTEPPPTSETPPREEGPGPGTPSGTEPSTTPPTPNIKTVPEGGATQEMAKVNDDLYKIVSNVNQVLVPVMVKDDSGRMVNGLLPKDFSVYEEGKKQDLNFFTTDPFALSAAIIIDTGMPDVALQKVNRTFPALEGAFSQFDEVSIYTYSSSVSKLTDFGAAGQRLTAVLNQLKTVQGRNNGPPITGGPLGPQGPTVNNVPIDPSTPRVITPPKESHVLNDAILMAAMDLSKRDRARRKVIFVISDGRESRSTASYSDTLKVLLSYNILVYGVAVEGSALPVYGKLQRLHLPKTGYSDILPKYANATGGEILNGFSRDAIESTYTRLLGEARNLYTLGYRTRGTPSTGYREIEVTVARPGCRSSSARPCVDVTAKPGYYPVGLSR